MSAKFISDLYILFDFLEAFGLCIGGGALLFFGLHLLDRKNPFAIAVLLVGLCFGLAGPLSILWG